MWKILFHSVLGKIEKYKCIFFFNNVALKIKDYEVKCGQYGDPYSQFLHLIHPSTHTHTERWADNAAEQLGVLCIAQGHLSHGIEREESAGYSLRPPTIPAGPETRTRDLQVTSPTLYPLGHSRLLYRIQKGTLIKLI